MPKPIWLVCEEGSFLIHAVSLQPEGLVVWHGVTTTRIISTPKDRGGRYLPGIQELAQRINDSILDGVKRLDIRSFERELKGTAAPTPTASAATAEQPKATARKTRAKKTT